MLLLSGYVLPESLGVCILNTANPLVHFTCFYIFLSLLGSWTPQEAEKRIQCYRLSHQAMKEQLERERKHFGIMMGEIAQRVSYPAAEFVMGAKL